MRKQILQYGGGKMNKELASKLQEKYSGILESNLYFEVGDGWYELIRNLLRMLNSYVEGTPLEGVFKIIQIKEKFGELRVYAVNVDEYIQGAIVLAEYLSNNVCEVSGTLVQNQSEDV